MGIALAVIFGVIALMVIALIAIAISIYNSMTRKKNYTEHAWGNIHTQERQRLDEMGQLVNTVKGYGEHEKDIQMAFAEARGALKTAGDSGNVKEMQKASEHMDNAMVNIRATSEAYPELKANENFIKLQDRISNLENKVAQSRRHYNNTVQDFNSSRQVFPTNIVASMMGFTEDKEYFEYDEEEARKAPTVEF